VVGAGAVGMDLARLLDEHPEYGVRTVGVVDDLPRSDNPLLVGGSADLPRLVAEHDVSHIFMAFGPTPSEDLVGLLRSTVLMDVEVHIVPRYFEVGLAPTGPDVDFVWGIPLYRVRRAALRAAAFRSKRLVDVAVSAGALVAVAPVLAFLAAIVRLTSRGPVLFRQERIGQHGRPIEVLKFRTMEVNDDSDVTWNVANDARLTPVGGLLRKLSLDELPQLWNVVRGDMSLVGPRPERPHFVDKFSPVVRGYGDRHRLPVGLTGLAQIHGLRGDTSIAERARFDNYYIEHWSLWKDVAILFGTVVAVIRDAAGRSGVPSVDDSSAGSSAAVEPSVDLRSVDLREAVGTMPHPVLSGSFPRAHAAAETGRGGSRRAGELVHEQQP
jgi:exopolysaccharide biosynthesis polyprenyl glycosylphosphotransferase